MWIAMHIFGRGKRFRVVRQAAGRQKRMRFGRAAKGDSGTGA